MKNLAKDSSKTKRLGVGWQRWAGWHCGLVSRRCDASLGFMKELKNTNEFSVAKRMVGIYSGNRKGRCDILTIHGRSKSVKSDVNGVNLPLSFTMVKI